MEIEVEGSARSKKFVEAMLPSIVRQLGLEKSRKALLIRVKNETEGDEGITIDLSKWTGAYLVILKPNRNIVQLGLALAHEMVHVKQLAKGTLKQRRSGHTWMGKMYSKKTPYLDMPWEIEAFSKQELILRRALEE